jgi:hypothetical protein
MQKQKNNIKKLVKAKYLWIIAGLIFGLVLLRIYTYSVNINNSVNTNVNNTNNTNNTVNEGFKNAGPKFKKTDEDKKYKIDKFANPLGHFGFKYSKEENFNNTGSGGSDDRLQNALDETDRLDVNSLSVNNMKGVLHQYNKNITEQLENVKDDNNLINVMNQGKVFANEFKKLFDVGLFI